MSYMGDYIKQKREEKKITVQYICDKTAIREQYINTLEAGEFDLLPSYVHAHGFLEQYCKVVGLDFYNEVKPLFDKECQKNTFGKTPEEIAIEQVVIEEASKKSPYMMFIVVVAGLLLAALAAFFFYNYMYKHSKDTSEVLYIPPIAVPSEPDIADLLPETVPVADAAADTLSIAVDNSSGNNAGTFAPSVTPVVVTPAPDNATLMVTVADNDTRRRAVLTFTDNCWVNFKSDSGTTEDFIADPGQIKVIYFSNYFSVDIGNASAISVSYQGRIFSGLGSYRQPMRNVYFVVDDNGTMELQRTPPTAAR